MTKTFREAAWITWPALLMLWLLSVADSSAATRSLTNSAVITIPAPASAEAASPYPSLITVSNLPGVVRRVTVDLHSLTHSNPDDLDILLVGPNGAAVLLMSDAGGTTDIAGVDLTFDDGVTNALPDMSAILSGTNRHGNFPPNPDLFPDPAPGPPFTNGLLVFNGIDPNGAWRLFVRDDLNPSDTGSLAGGWTLNITTDVLRINEWLIRNTNNLADPADGQFESWFELFNAGSFPVNLGPFYLTDDLNNRTRFHLPAGTNIPPGGRLLVWADGETNQNPAVDVHASFTLSGDGGVIGLFSVEGALVDAIGYGPQTVNISQGRCPDGAPVIRIQGIPTPRTSNDCSLNLTPLTLIQLPLSQTVTAGTTVTLSVGASGLEPLNYRWLWEGGRLLGATNSTIVLTNAQPTDGGWYAVIVSDAMQSLVSPPALVRVQPATNYPFSDTFGTSALVTNASGVATTNNLLATSQPGEPQHAGKPGTNSMWFRWKFDADGVVTFNTLGSDFDTLLAAYHGPDVGSLTPLASSDDNSGRFTSRIRFNVAANETNHIAIAGYNDARGNIVLTWNFMPGNLAPLIHFAPTNRAVPLGASTTFQVGASQGSTYQWFLNGSAIPGATADTFVIASVQPFDLGYYSVRVTNSMNAMAYAESLPVRLEIGPVGHLVSRDKRGDLFLDPPPTNSSFAPVPKANAATGGSTPGFISVAPGSLSRQLLYSTNSFVDGGTTNACFTASATRWFGLKTSHDGYSFVLDTSGSTNPTVLAIYAGTISGYSLVNCTNQAAAEVRFNARREEPYSIHLNGLGVAEGLLNLNWRLGSDPVITTPPASVSVVSNPAAYVTFTNLATGVPQPTNQWQVFTNDGWLDLVGSNATTLAVPAIASGQYRAVATNFMGAATSAVATLTVLLPPRISQQPASQIVTENETVTFSAGVEGTAPFTYQWLANGSPWPGATSDSFTIHPVTTNLSGTQFCLHVANVAGSTTSSVATLTVYWAPKVLFPPQNVSTNEGSSVSFAVTATANPPPAYQWLRDTSPDILGTNASLVFASVQTSDAGIYRVEMSNAVGSNTAMATLAVTSLRVDLLNSSVLTNGVFTFTLSGPVGHYAIDVSSDLTNWTAWSTNFNATGLLQITDPVGLGTYSRFYRGRFVP